MERVYLKNLIEWNNDDDRKPLLVLGARQVGKTYLIKDMFAETFYKNNYLRIDCSDNEDFVNYVFKNSSLSNVLEYIKIHYDFVPDSKHLLIFDEVQECLPLIKMMKHFCEERRDVPLIVTGSLVRIKLYRQTHKRGSYANKSFLFPVGKINQLTMYPLTFNEFLMNYKKPTFEYLNDCFLNNKEIPFEIHNELMEIFNDYLFVGGMPEVVDIFIKNKDDKLLAYQKAHKKIKEIYSDYLDDMDLYQVSTESILRSRLVYRNIYSELNKECKNFKPSLIEKDSINRDMRSPIDWLTLSYVINKSTLVKEKVAIPLIDSNENLFRLYLSDVGMFTLQSNVNPTTFIDKDSSNTLSGIFYENYVANELTMGGYKLFYWKGKNNAEFEFIIEYGSNIIPIDVKKSKGTLSSLEKFKNHNKLFTAVKISQNYFGYNKDNKILTIPFYYVSFFINALKNHDLEGLIK